MMLGCNFSNGVTGLDGVTVGVGNDAAKTGEAGEQGKSEERFLELDNVYHLWNRLCRI
jgi:hypothetical protein